MILERSFMNMALGIKFPVLLTVLLRIMNSGYDVYKHAKKQIKMRFVHQEVRLRLVFTVVNQCLRCSRKVEDLHLPLLSPFRSKEEAQARRSLFFGWAAWFTPLEQHLCHLWDGLSLLVPV